MAVGSFDYGAGGQSAIANYCGRCCGQGGTGGGGVQSDIPLK